MATNNPRFYTMSYYTRIITGQKVPQELSIHYLPRRLLYGLTNVQTEVNPVFILKGLRL